MEKSVFKNNNDLFNLDEYQLYGNGSSKIMDDDIIVKNCLKMYINEMSEYPLLKSDEEMRYLNMLSNPETKKLLVLKESGSYTVSDLDTRKLFYSLCDNNLYKIIIDSLIKFYSRLNSHNDKTVLLLQEYLKESNKLNRSLNQDEIVRIFHFEKVDETLNEKELLHEIKEFMNYKFAFDKMFVSNLRLVISIATKCRGNLSLLDLINEGNLGLMKAIQKYDTKIGGKFSTYAGNWIYSFIRRAIINAHSVVRLPVNQVEDFYVFKHKINALEKAEGKNLSYDEISTKLGISLENVKQFYLFQKGDVYLNSKTKPGEETELKDAIPSNVDYEDIISDPIPKEEIEKLLSVLMDREKTIIKMYYGIGEYHGRKLSIIEMASLMHVSRQCVNQIKVRAMSKLQQYYKNNEEMQYLKDFIR